MNKTFVIRIIIISTSVAVAIIGLLAYNYFGTDLTALPRETTIVERVYHKTEYRTQRVGRGRYTRTNPHEVYYLSLHRPDGSTKNVKVNYEIYKRASKGDTALLPIGPGRLGWEVSDARHLTIPHPRKPEKRHCRFVGTSGRKISPDSILGRRKNPETDGKAISETDGEGSSECRHTNVK